MERTFLRRCRRAGEISTERSLRNKEIKIIRVIAGRVYTNGVERWKHEMLGGIIFSWHR